MGSKLREFIASLKQAKNNEVDDRAREERYKEMYNGRLESLEKTIARLKALGSEASGAGAGLIAQAKSLAAMGQFADAYDPLEAAYDLLSNALEQAEAASPEGATFIAQLESLEETIARLKELGSEASGAGLIAQAKSFATMGQFGDASARLEKAHDLLSDALWQAEGPSASPEEEADNAQLEAEDLKSTLKRVLASGGEKKFFFAYGTGKRKDGKGDGEL